LSGASRTALAEFPHRNARLPRLVGEVLGDAGTGESDRTNRHRVEHLIVAFEERGVLVAGPVGFEDDLQDITSFSLS